MTGGWSLNVIEACGAWFGGVYGWRVLNGVFLADRMPSAARDWAGRMLIALLLAHEFGLV